MIFAANDLMAIGAMRAIQDQVAVIGFDDLPIAAIANPPLTTVRQPIKELSVAAVTLLSNRSKSASGSPRPPPA